MVLCIHILSIELVDLYPGDRHRLFVSRSHPGSPAPSQGSMVFCHSGHHKPGVRRSFRLLSRCVRSISDRTRSLCVLLAPAHSVSVPGLPTEKAVATHDDDGGVQSFVHLPGLPDRYNGALQYLVLVLEQLHATERYPIERLAAVVVHRVPRNRGRWFPEPG